MDRRLYVGNLSYASDDDDLRELFEEFGEVLHAEIVIDYKTGASKGYGFVEMSTSSEAASAKDQLDGSQFDGRTIRVAPAERHKRHRPRGPKRYNELPRNNSRRRTSDYWN